MTDYPSGWTCEVTVLRFERYLLSTLPLGEALAVAEHIEACVTCAQRLVLFELPDNNRAGRRGR
jgi:hypothetical protein